MKIACQSCQAKYTIADEKVLGRVVKIRCKKCGATIVINGNETGAAGAEMPEERTVAMPNSQAFDYAGQQAEEPWTVNVADGDQRTMTTADLVAQFKAGVVNDETYCWKDGMGDWLPLREIEPLSAACGLGAGAQAPAQQYGQEPQYGQPAPAAGAGLGALFGGGDAGAYAASPAEANGNGASYGMGVSPAPAAAAARRVGGRAGGADLFGTAAEAGGENDVMTSAPQGSPAMHEGDASKLTGQRNENSVLFSLNALTQNAPKEDVPGPQGDGSGLIDIRALSATMQPQAKKSNHVDDIMNLGGGGAFSAALAAPVLAAPAADAGDVYGAPAPEGGKSNKMVIVLLAVVGVLVAVLLVVLLTKKPDTTAAATPGAGATTPTPSAGPVAANDTASAAPATPPPADSTAAASGPAPVDPTKANTAGGAVAATTPKRSGGGSSSTSSGGGTAPAAVAAVVPKETSQPNSLDEMMKKSAGGGSAPPAPAAGGSTAPFDRGAAAGALGAVNVASCKRPDGPTGPGHVSVTFAPDGSVATAQVDQPPFAGTAVGGCVAGKFRGARVPAFSGGSVKVGKSFVIN
jgi:predicted Zn finger-like uncharacterized protein